MKQLLFINHKNLNFILGLAIAAIISGALIPNNAYASLSAGSNDNSARKWCNAYRDRTHQECKVGYKHCPKGYKQAKKFGRMRINRAYSCIKGNVRNKKSPSYVLMCRGGGRMFASVPVKGGNIEVKGAKKARVGATARKPAKGECAFMDRGIRAGEPIVLLFKNKKPALLNVKVYPGKVDSMFQGGFKQVLNAIRSSSYFYVHVKNNRGWFEVTRVGL